MSKLIDYNVLLIGLDNEVKNAVRKSCKDAKVQEIDNEKALDDLLDNYLINGDTPVLVGDCFDGISAIELSQVLTSTFQGIRPVFVTTSRSKFEVTKLRKNGFEESLLLPFDNSVLEDMLIEALRSKGAGAFKRYKPIKLIDIKPGEQLPFDIRMFLPLNNKYVPVSGSGILSEKKYESLRKKNINSLFIEVSQLKQFYNYTAEKLIAQGLSADDAQSETERSEALKKSVRALFQTILDATDDNGSYEDGKELFEQSKQIVNHYVEKKIGVNLENQFKQVVDASDDSYSHAQKVSAMSCLMSMAIGIGNPEDVAIAGLFHDIGIDGSNEEVTIFNIDKSDTEYYENFMMHPRRSSNLLKHKKVTILPEVNAMIEFHHERTDGTGPFKMAAHRIPPGAHLIGYMDAFEYLSRPAAKERSLTPLEIHKKIIAELDLLPEVTDKIGSFLKSMVAPDATNVEIDNNKDTAA